MTRGYRENKTVVVLHFDVRGDLGVRFFRGSRPRAPPHSLIAPPPAPPPLILPHSSYKTPSSDFLPIPSVSPHSSYFRQETPLLLPFTPPYLPGVQLPSVKTGTGD